MNICYTLPDRAKLAAEKAVGKEPFIYCVPYDLDISGNMINGWIAVTAIHLLLICDDYVESCIELSSGTEFLCSPQVDCGILVMRSDGHDKLICRFSMKHLIRITYVANGATLFCRGETRQLESKERERYCANCGRVLPGTEQCPRCAGAGRKLMRIAGLFKSSRTMLPVVVACMAALSAISVAQQDVLRRFIDGILRPASGTGKQIIAFAALMLSMLIASLICSIVNTISSNRMGTRISRDLRTRVYTKINALSLGFINSRQSGELMNRVVEDTTRIREFFEQFFAHMFTTIFVMAGAMVMMLFMNWRLTLLTIAFVPAAMIFSRLFKRFEMRLFRQQWRLDDRVNNRLQDVLSGIRTVKSFGQEQREIERFTDYTKRLMQIQRRNELFWATAYPFVSLIAVSGMFFVTYFGGRGVLYGTMTPGELIQFTAYANMLYMPVQFVSRLPRMIMRMLTALERVYDILDEREELDDEKDAVDIEIVGDIEFENVSFGYKLYEPVLENISLKVNKGEMIGLVGASGAGKSTLINLVMRLYEVDNGCILIDGTPITRLSKHSLHGQIGVVLQETFLFSGTIFENIRYARRDASLREVIAAAKMANAHDFITKFPDGYNTYVGERGHTLSGGERQRVAIARAILHNPRLLILDEATSSLDTETEFLIQQALKRLTGGRTTFAIAHRLSTLRDADRIIVIDKKQIAESGTHEELMSRDNGIYRGLVMAQLEMSAVEAEPKRGRK